MSAGRPRVPAYFTVARSIFDHEFFKSTDPFSRREAWLWLLCFAAWRPDGRRNKHGVFHNERRQLSITQRELGAAWNWSQAKVRRFLDRLAEDERIVLGKVRAASKTGAENASEKGYERTLITICNYDKFQPQSWAANRAAAQEAAQESAQNAPSIPGLMEPIGLETDRSIRINNESVATLNKPAHGSVSKDGRWLWYDHPSGLWQMWAESYRRAHKSDILPERRIEGQGNWFYRAGEHLRPKPRTRRKTA